VWLVTARPGAAATTLARIDPRFDTGRAAGLLRCSKELQILVLASSCSYD
jgi:hypothetical protein